MQSQNADVRTPPKFTARKVPDFAAMHAREDARVARWKRTHKREITVPLGFRFNAAAHLRPNDNPLGPSQTTNMQGVTRPSTAKMVDAAADGISRMTIKSTQRDDRPSTAAPTARESVKENAALQGGGGDARAGPPSTQMLYPAGFKNRPNTAAAYTHTTFSDGSSQSTRPSSAMSADTHAHTQANKTSVDSSAVLSHSSVASSEASRAPTATGERPSTAPAARSAADSRPKDAAASVGQDSGQNIGVKGQSRGGSSSSKNVYVQSQQQQEPGSLEPMVQPAPVVQREVPQIDIKALQKLVSTLPSTLKQPFSSADFYIFGKTLGEGAYGKVKLGTHLLADEKVAVKTFEKSKLTESHARKRVAREIRILKALNHPNIIKLYEVVDVPARKYLIMQYSSAGDLCRYVREKRRLENSEACRLFSQIVRGLQYCHSCGIVHRDVKLDNLLIDEHKNIKIVDFGFSVSFKEGQKLRKACGSPSYAAPEIVARRPYNPTGVDVWSLGVVLYAMICGYFPFQGSSNQDLCRRIVKGKFECPSFMSSECRDLVRKMLNTEAHLRISLSDAEQHVWCRQTMQSQTPPASTRPRTIDCERSEDSLEGREERDEIEVDDSVVARCVQMGFREDYVRGCVKRNMHNVCTTAYWLLHTKKAGAAHRGSESSSPSGETQATPAKRMMV